MVVALVFAGEIGMAAAQVPLARPKPAISAVLAAAEGHVSRTIVPLPRPKPGRSVARPPTPTAPALAFAGFGPLKLGSSGRIDVSLDALERERDPAKAKNLAPGTGSKWSMAAVKAARDRCAFVLAATNLAAEQPEPIGGPQGCGIAAPLKVAAFGAVSVSPQATLNCPMALAVYKWMTDVVQPAAREAFGEPVVAVRNASAYSCRRRNNGSRGRISEHSFGNAFDVASFELASGKSVSVEGDWSSFGAIIGFAARAKFLKAIHAGACEVFSTVLGPRANALHEDHFHVDLGRGGQYKYCR